MRQPTPATPVNPAIWPRRHRWKTTGVLTLGLALGLGGSAWAQDVGSPSVAVSASVSAVDQIRSQFDAAMAKPLAQRVSELEALERQIDQSLLQDQLSGKARAQGLYYKHHVQVQLARFPEAYGTYAEHLQAVKSSGDASGGVKAAEAAFLRDLNRWVLTRDHPHLAGVCEQVIERLASDPELKSAALYHLALANYRMNGTIERCVETCNSLIAEHPESPWRGQAMRLLANAHFAMGKYDESLGTLELIKQQYPDTDLEHYADMRAAAVWEYGRGDPQKALAVYQATLQNHKDHLYAPYVHRQMERLHGVIEQQLIQDALEGLAKKPPEGEAVPEDEAAVDIDDAVAPAPAAEQEAVKPDTTGPIATR